MALRPAYSFRTTLTILTGGLSVWPSADDPTRKVLLAAAARHAEAALKHVASGDYAGEHWLASFAVYMLSR